MRPSREIHGEHRKGRRTGTGPRRTLAAALLAGLAGLPGVLAAAGCGVLGPQQADPQEARRLSQVPYPSEAPFGDDLDIVVRQDGGRIELSNRTARGYENVQLWLNRQYVTTLERVRVGENPSRALRHFVNAHGEAYPTAGLLNPDNAFPVVNAELFDPATGQRHRLLARSDLDLQE